MNKSHYFEELSAAYSAEIDDLAHDFEGKPVLTARLKEKRAGIDTMVQMIEAAPEMVFPVFHGAFTFAQTGPIIRALQAEPDDEDFPLWDAIAGSITLADWVAPLAQKVLAEPGGERFMVSAAAVEFLRIRETSTPDSAREAVESDKNEGDEDENGDGDDKDLAESGADWLSEQGFDSRSA